VVSFTPRPLYPQGKSPRYPLDRRLGGPQSRSGYGVEEKNSQPPPGIEPRSYIDESVTSLFTPNENAGAINKMEKRLKGSRHWRSPYEDPPPQVLTLPSRHAYHTHIQSGPGTTS
jgi:hypothetical protein